MSAFFHLRPAKGDAEEPVQLSGEERKARFVEYLITGALDKAVGLLKVPSLRHDRALQGDVLCECIVISGGKAHGPRSQTLKKYYLPNGYDGGNSRTR